MAQPAIQTPARARRRISRRRGQSLGPSSPVTKHLPDASRPTAARIDLAPDRRTRAPARTSGTNLGDLLPVLEVADGSPSNAIRGISERLGIRAEPSPSTFTADDALRLLRAAPRTVPGPIDASDLREVIKPVYRQLFELLSGHSSAVGVSLSEAPLLANTAQGLRFLPVTEVLLRPLRGSGSAAESLAPCRRSFSRPRRLLQRRSGFCSVFGFLKRRSNGSRILGSQASTLWRSRPCVLG